MIYFGKVVETTVPSVWANYLQSTNTSGTVVFTTSPQTMLHCKLHVEWITYLKEDEEKAMAILDCLLLVKK